MLQARALSCIILLGAGVGLAADLHGQDPAAAVTPSGAAAQTVAVARLLSQAAEAFDAGRIDRPPDDCAWYYYRSALELEPGNTAAVRGLVEVQRVLADRAMAYARQLDFENADRMLEMAAEVRDDPDVIERYRGEMAEFRGVYAADLEARTLQAIDERDFRRAERILIDLITLGDQQSRVDALRRRMNEARNYGGFQPGQGIADPLLSGNGLTPETVIIEAGSFTMGSPSREAGHRDNEGPQHRVTFKRGFAIGRTEVTVAQFRAFIEAAPYRTDAEKQGYSVVYDQGSGRLMQRDGVNWKHDYVGRDASDDLPVVHVSWNDATAYTRWLTQATGQRYRLPSEAEFEFVLRAGRKTPYWWGEGSPDRLVENLTGERDLSRKGRQWEAFFRGYTDQHWGPAPVASFEAHPAGIHDIGGNVSEWVLDCWHDTYLRAPTDGSAWVNPGCRQRVIRGGYWASSPDQARSAYRTSATPDRRDARIGFRVVRDL